MQIEVLLHDAIELLEEPDELLRPVAGLAPADHDADFTSRAANSFVVPLRL